MMIFATATNPGEAFHMAENSFDRSGNDEDILIFEVSDSALEAAANAIPGAALSFPNSPTVSILFACCSND